MARVLLLLLGFGCCAHAWSHAVGTRGSHVFAAAICEVDRPFTGFVGFRGRHDTSHAWTNKELGDLIFPFNPGVAAVSRNADGAAFGYTAAANQRFSVLVDRAN